jgi:hypothetical protein
MLTGFYLLLYIYIYIYKERERERERERRGYEFSNMIIQEAQIIKLIKIFQILTLDMYQMTKKKHIRRRHLLNKFLNRDIN